MSDGANIPSGENQSPSGNTGANGGSNKPSEDGKVAYETHQKLLGEKKKVAEKLTQMEQELEAFKAKERERENAELERNKNFEQLLKNRDQELNETKSKLTQIDQERKTAKRLNSFLKTLGGDLPEHYWSLVPIDEIAIDPTTGQVDEMSVASVAENYRRMFPETIKLVNGKSGMPSNTPSGDPQGKMDYEAWLKMDSKDPNKWAAVKEGRVNIKKGE